MGDCHINIIADFSDDFGLKLDLQGRTLLGVEGWTGGRKVGLSDHKGSSAGSGF